MEKNSIATSIEQSKRLLELGIDPNTASMSHDRWEFKGKCGYTLMTQPISASFSHKDAIPAWTLGNLISILPNKVVIDGSHCFLSLRKTGILYLGTMTLNVHLRIPTENDNLIDACCKMIIKLHELNLL